MPESLIDFGQIAQTMQGFERNRIYEENSIQQREQNRLHALQLKQNAEHMQLGGLLKLADDPTISANPAKKNQVLSAAWKLAGLPDVDVRDFQRGLDARQEHLQGLLENDPAKAADAFVKVAASASPTELKQLTDAAKDYHTLRDRIENVNAMQQYDQARFDKLHANQAKVDIGLFPYAQGVRDFTAALHGTDQKEFMTNMLMFSKLGPEKGKAIATPPMAATTAKNANDLAERYSQIADQAKMQLTLLENGQPLAKGQHKRDFVEQVEVGSRMAEAYDTLGQWALNPYDKTTLKAARTAKSTIEGYRKELDKLDAANKSENIAVARDSLSFKQSEAGIKHFHEQAVSEAQINFGKSVDAFRQRTGTEPSNENINTIATQVQTKFPGVLSQEITAGYNASRAHKPGGEGFDAKDYQQMFNGVLNYAAKNSGNSGMQFSTGEGGVVAFEMGTIKDPVKFATEIEGLATAQTYLPPVVLKALLNTATRLRAGKSSGVSLSPASTTEPSMQDREIGLRKKLGLSPP